MLRLFFSTTHIGLYLFIFVSGLCFGATWQKQQHAKSLVKAWKLDAQVLGSSLEFWIQNVAKTATKQEEIRNATKKARSSDAQLESFFSTPLPPALLPSGGLLGKTVPASDQ